MSVPIFITCRDRLAPLKGLIAWLEIANQEEIYLIDNDSTYPPLLDFYEETSHNVIRVGHNNGQHVAWNLQFVDNIARDRFFVVTDPDVVPDQNCPLDAIDYFQNLLEEYIPYNKAGFGLRIDDIPDTYKFKQAVINWEKQFVNSIIKPNIFHSQIDTTFALYRPHASPDIGQSIRTGAPYLARHTTWYIDSENPSEEDIYYRDHASGTITNWAKDELGGWYPR